MILYGSSISPFVRKVIVFAAEKNIEMDVERIGLGDANPGFLAASPFRKMPAFRDGDYCLADSSAICHYLDAKYPKPALIPDDPQLRGRTVWFDEFADTVLFECGRKLFFNRMVAPRFLGRPGDDAVADKAERDELPPILDYLERTVPDSGAYLVGDSLTLADISVASPFVNFEHIRLAIDPARYPRTIAFVTRILARPSFAEIVERERAFLAKVAA